MIAVTPLHFVYMLLLGVFTSYVLAWYRTDNPQLRSKFASGVIITGIIAVAVWWASRP